MVCGQTLIVDGGFSLPRLMEPTEQNRRAWDESTASAAGPPASAACPARCATRSPT